MNADTTYLDSERRVERIVLGFPDRLSPFSGELSLKIGKLQ